MRFLLLAAAFVAATPLVSKLMTAPPAGRIGGHGVPREKSGRSFKDAKDILLQAFRGMGEHNTSLLAAGVAFYALFALFPALGAATWILGLVADPATIKNQLTSLKDVLPAESWKLIEQQLNTLTSQSTSISLAGIFSLVVALYSARLAASSMMAALNVVYGVKETRGFISTNAIAILFTLVAIGILFVAIGVLVAAPIIFNYVGLSSASTMLIRYLRWPVLAILMALALALVFRYGPNREDARWRWLSWGSGTATVLWLVVSWGFSWYVAAFNSYDKVYGSIGAVVVLLFWFWLSSFTGLLGAELDNAIERKYGPPPVEEGSPKAA